MKQLLFLLLLSNIISCKKHDFDLDKTTFPIDLKSLKVKYKVRENKDFSDMLLYNTTDESLLYFDGFDFSGSLDKEDNSILTTNNVVFYEENKTKKIDAYAIEIKTTNEAVEFEKRLETKFGKTDFYYRSKDFSFRIWEIDNKTYFLETNNTGKYNDIEFKSCYLNVVNNTNSFFYQIFIGGGFTYYGDYLYEKEKPQNKKRKYTYQDFVNDKEKEDGADSYFIKNYMK